MKRNLQDDMQTITALRTRLNIPADANLYAVDWASGDVAFSRMADGYGEHKIHEVIYCNVDGACFACEPMTKEARVHMRRWTHY